MFILAVAGVAFLLLMAARHWGDLREEDMGTMSGQWLAEYNAQHPLQE